MKSKSFMRQQPHHLDQSTPLRGADPTAEDGDTAPEKCRRRLSHRLLGSLHVGFVPLLEKQGTRQNNPPSIDRGSLFFFPVCFPAPETGHSGEGEGNFCSFCLLCSVYSFRFSRGLIALLVFFLLCFGF